MSESLEKDALFYLTKNLTVIPIKGRYGKDENDAKRPLAKWEKWQGRKPSAENIKSWFLKYPNADIGLLTGPTNGILVVDIDGEDGYKSMSDKPLPDTWVSCTKRGEHYIFKWDKRLDGIATTKVGLLHHVDTRGKGGYIVAPPSSGLGDRKYHWKPGHTPSDVQLANPPEWLVQLLLKEEAKQYQAPAPNDGKKSWLEETWEGVAHGENRHKAMTRLASFYMSRGLFKEDVMQLMKQWNERCNPPKPEDEFEFKLGQFLENWDKGRYQSNYNIETKLQVSSAKSFLDSGPTNVDWVVKDYIPREAITFVHGYGGVGKSFITMDLAIEMGRGGGAWLKQFPVLGGRVLYIDEESHPTLLRQRFSCMLRDKELNKDNVDVHFLSLPGIKFDNDGSLDSLRSLLIELKPDLVVIDPFVAIHNLNENKSNDMAKLRGIFKSIIKDFKCGLLFIDHENKPGDEPRSAAQRQRGSSEKDAVADVKIAISSTVNGKLFEHSKARYGPTMPTHEFEIAETGVGKIAVRVV